MNRAYTATPNAKDCAQDQSGPVWFVIGTFGTTAGTCTVPAGRALAIAPAIWECSVGGGDGKTFAALSKCASGYMDKVKQSDATVDGLHFTGLLTRYRFRSPAFPSSTPLTT